MTWNNPLPYDRERDRPPDTRPCPAYCTGGEFVSDACPNRCARPAGIGHLHRCAQHR